MTSFVPPERMFPCLPCRGHGLLPAKAGCGVTRCVVCRGRGFFYIPGPAIQSRPACEHGKKGGGKKVKAIATALALCLLVPLLSSCAALCPRPPVCSCAAPVRAYPPDRHLDSIEAQLRRDEDKRREDAEVEALEAANAAANARAVRP